MFNFLIQKGFGWTGRIILALAVIVLVSKYFVDYQALGDTIINKTLTVNPDLNDGLVLHYTFDGTSLTSTVVTDMSSGGNDGTVSGAVPVVGKIGQAVSFDGVNDYIDVGDASQIGPTDEVSVCAWYYPRSWGPSSSDQDIIFRVSTANDILTSADYVFEFNLGLQDGGLHRNLTFMGFSSAISAEYSGTGSIIDLNEWHHLCATHTSNFRAIYVDGVERASSIATHNMINTTNSLYVGGRTGSTDVSDAILDDARVYDRAISPEEIKRLYEQGATTHINTTITTNENLNDSLVGHWTFDGSDMVGGVLDASGNGNTGSLVNFTSTTTAVGRIGQSLEFDGADDYVSVQGDASLNDIFVGGGSVSWWMNIPNAGEADSGHWIQKFTDFNIFAYCCSGVVATGLEFNIDWSGSPSAKWRGFLSTPITFGEWHHITLTYNGDSVDNDPVVYVDGVLITSAFDEIVTPSGTFETGSNNEYHFGGNAAASRAQGGKFDDIRFYDKELSSAEVLRLYQQGATTHINTTITPSNSVSTSLDDGLLGHWTFDGPNVDGTTISDTSGNGHDGVAFNGPIPTVGVVGQAFKFDGTNDYIEITSSVTGDFNFPEDSTYTISAWAKLDSVPSFYSNIVAKGDRQYSLQATSGGDWEFFEYQSGVGWALTSAPATVGVWTHVVAVRDGTAQRLYVDGVLEDDSISIASFGGGRITSYDLQIGSDEQENLYFPGDIDDVRIYDRVLSPKEIQRLYELGGS